MGIETIRQVILKCDRCWCNCVECDVTQKSIISKARKAGWLISEKLTLCVDCRKLQEGKDHGN